MNSLQLVSKIKSKSEDINQNIRQILDAGSSLSLIDKELLKKQCLDIYELILKLKTEADELEEKLIVKTLIPVEPIKPPLKSYVEPTKPIEEVKPPVLKLDEPVLKSENFKEVLNWAENSTETLDSIEHKIEIKTEEQIEPKIPNKPDSIDHPIEINFEKAVENKRIQYTVLPEIETSKPLNLNSIFQEKETSYNDKIAQKIQPNLIPLADKTIEAKIDNLKSAINLNKKIAFVNDLFKENAVEYAKAIDKLNNAEDRNEALRMFNEFRLLYNWQNNNELVQELEKLVKRRHM